MSKKMSFFQSTIVRTVFGGFLLIILPLTTLSSFCLSWGAEHLQDEMTRSYYSSAKIVSESLSDSLLTLQNTAATYLLDDECIRLSAVSAAEPNYFSLARFHSRIRQQFLSSFLEADMTCVFPAQQLAVSTKNGVDHLSRYPLLSDLEELGRSQPAWALRPSYRDPEKQCLSIAIGYVHAAQTRPVIILEISEEALDSQLSGLLPESSGVQASFFLDYQGAWTASDPSGYLTEAAIEDVPGHMESGDIFSTAEANGKYLRIVPVQMDDIRCVLGIAFDEQIILAPVTFMKRVLTVLLITGFLLTTAYLLHGYRKVYIPTQMLVSSMERLALGELSVRVDQKLKGEFQVLAENFNSTAQRLETLVKEKYLAEVKLKSAQVNFLRSQINPHFLYNSLFNLYNMIKSQELDNAADMAIYLGQYYRIGAHLDKQELTLAQEVENILPYLKIHQIRMSGGLEFTCDIQPGLEDFEIPCLSLQSLVENSITHAFNKIQQSAYLKIQAVREGDFVALSVEDNGSGIDEADKEAILRRLENYNEEGEVHGLQNIYARLHLLHGEQVSLSIEPAEPRGTRVCLRIPYTKGSGSHV